MKGAGCWVLGTGYWLLGTDPKIDSNNTQHLEPSTQNPKSSHMSGFKDLEIYQIAFELALKVHFAALKLPKFELYEQGSQIRLSSKGVKDTIFHPVK